MKRYNNIFIIIFAIILITTSCKSSRTATEIGSQNYSSDNKRYATVVEQYKDWSTLTASGRMNIAMGSSFSSAMQLKMVKNKSISISLRPLLGIEMARMFITSDSIYIIDKYHKMYLAEKITDLTHGFPIEINALQSIILNRAFVLGKGEISQKTQKAVSVKDVNDLNSWEILPKNQISNFIYSFVFNYNNELTSLNVESKNIARSFALKYNNFNPTEIGNIATAMHFQTVIKEKSISLNVNFDASKIRLNNVFEDNIEINPSYKRIAASAIPMILNNLQ